MMKLFTVTTNCYLIIEAKSLKEARAIYEAGEFNPSDIQLAEDYEIMED